MARLFVSVDLQDELYPEIRPLRHRLKKTKADLNMVDLEKVHFTLKFLGDTDTEHVDEVVEVMESSTADSQVFELEVADVGVFPARDYISVIWVGAEKGTSELESINEGLEEGLVARGLAEPEDHDFTPHATLARMKSGRGKSEIHKFLDDYAGERFGRFTVESIELVESSLESDGPVYSTVETVDL
ncbi:MAG: RNA 2',3'-cyclic phosphodiesterase [Halobacteria archaeon]